MRAALLFAALAALSACQAWEAPWTEIGSHSIEGPWPGYGFPTAGGKVNRADEDVIVATLPARSQAERQALYGRWESALARRHRRTERSGDLITAGFRSTGFLGDDGARYLLTGERQGPSVRLSVRRIAR